MSELWSPWVRAAAALGIAPRDFWLLSVKEWRALIEAEVAGMTRRELEALASLFPDDME